MKGLREGLYFGVYADSDEPSKGTGTSGAKLYERVGDATRSAGEGGSVFKLVLEEDGFAVYCVSGPDSTHLGPIKPKTFFLNERHEL